MTIDKAELERLRGLEAKATKGEWVKNTGMSGVVTNDGLMTGISNANSEFIAATRNALPSLIAEIERLTKENGELREMERRRAEINRRPNAELSQVVKAMTKAEDARASHAIARVDVLEKALREIQQATHVVRLCDARDIARKALEGE